MLLLFCFHVLISGENKNKKGNLKKGGGGGRVKLSGFYSANVYCSQCHVKVLFAQERSHYLYTKTLRPHHLVGFSCGNAFV